MQTHQWPRPRPGDHVAYFDRYVDLVPEGDVCQILQDQYSQTRALLESLDDDAARHRYAANKWSIKEIIGHMIDTERIFACRCLRFARHDKTPLPGFEQDIYVANANFDARPLVHLLDEFGVVRGASILLFRSLPESSLTRGGEASGSVLTVRSVPYILAGHELHHVSVIRQLYLNGSG